MSGCNSSLNIADSAEDTGEEPITMWHTRTQRFTYYVILSTLLHVLCLAGVLGYFRLLPHTLPLPEAVRITLAAPALPAEPRLAPGTPLSHVLPTPPPSVPLTMDASPSLAVVDLPAPQPISAPPRLPSLLR